MSNEILALMCHEMIKSLNECLEVLEHPVDCQRNLAEKWKKNIEMAYCVLSDEANEKQRR